MSTDFAFAGSISSGTLRSQDLMTRFLAVLQQLEPTSAANLEDDVAGALELFKADDAEAEQVAGDVVEQLTEALELAAPSGYTFGTHEGDAADFGFWPDEEEDDRAASITGTITLSDGSTSQFAINHGEAAWSQWGADGERLGRTVPILDAIRDTLLADDLLGD